MTKYVSIGLAGGALLACWANPWEPVVFTAVLVGVPIVIGKIIRAMVKAVRPVAV